MASKSEIAYIMLEAAELLREDLIEQESLNEGILSKLFKRKNDKKVINVDNHTPSTKSSKSTNVQKTKYTILSEDKYNEKEKEFKSAYDECIKAINKVVKSSKGFKVNSFDGMWSDVNYYNHNTQKTSPATYTAVVGWDLWDIYPDARTRYQNNDLEYFEKTYDSIVKLMRPIASKYNLTIADDCDWDGGYIVLVRYGVAYDCCPNN